MITADSTDATLVAASLRGNRDAFAQIVARYQALVCSLAYSSTGNLNQSEDLAQETFVTAWKELSRLKEPQKLRSWICGIARNLIHNSLRRHSKEPAHHAESLDVIHESAGEAPLPSEQTIGKEEEAILWRSLERIPESYREPLVLFYREGQSVERVAAELELTEDAVKQRLSRGRKLLADEVTAFVEGALKQSAPGRAFTIGVLSALPALATSATAATIGAGAAKGSTTAKAAGVAGLAGVFLGPLLAMFGTWVGYRTSLDDAGSEEERRFVKSFYRGLTASLVGFFIGFAGLMMFSRPILKTGSTLFITLLLILTLGYVIAIVWLSVWSSRVRKKFYADLDASRTAGKSKKPAYEYRSQLHWLGLPFFHIRIGGGLASQRHPVKAWIAIGDTAFGGLFAFGGFALAPVSIGGCAFGLLPFGGCALGLLALGGLSAGVWSFGGLAFGYQTYSGCGIAWNAAVGGVAMARDYALGAVAHAATANTKAAVAFIESQPFFRAAHGSIDYIAWLNLVWVLPMMCWWWLVARMKKRNSN